MLKIIRVISHPMTIINFSLFGVLAMIQFIHTKAHHTMEYDVHSHVGQALIKNPELARSACWKLNK